MKEEKLQLVCDALRLSANSWESLRDALDSSTEWAPAKAERVVTELTSKFMRSKRSEEFYRWALVKAASLALEDEEERS